VGVGHAQFLTLVDIGGATHEVAAGGEHLGALAMKRAVVAQARHDTRLIVVAPEQRVPAAARLHALLPGLEQMLELDDVGACESPFVTVPIVDLEVVEAERHRELVT